MMKHIVTLICICITALSYGSKNESKEEIFIEISKVSERTIDSMTMDQALFIFNIQGLFESDSNAVVQYTLDGISSRKRLSNSSFEVETTPGKHVFQFYLTSNLKRTGYSSIFRDSLEIGAQVEATYLANVLSIQEPQVIDPMPIQTIRTEKVLCKPVIYLYPEEQTEIQVEVDIHGHSPIFYPKYEEGWSVLAEPNGQLEIGDENYRYLFWESTEVDYLTSIDLNEGFVVNGSNVVAFLEEHLNSFGFTAAERADFITYWGPKMATNDYSLVRFEFNESCDKFAELNISPKPDNVYRFYIFISSIEGDYYVKPQVIPVMNRNGFTVLEWGGQISDYQPKITL
jgi:hypothetical protein